MLGGTQKQGPDQGKEQVRTEHCGCFCDGVGFNAPSENVGSRASKKCGTQVKDEDEYRSDFDTTCRGAGAAADEHQDNGQELSGIG